MRRKRMKVQRDVVVKNLMGYLNDRMELDEGFDGLIDPLLNIEMTKKRPILAKPGDVFQNLIWMENSYARLFVIEEDKEGLPYEKTIDFAMPQNLLSIPECFFCGLPAVYYLQLGREAITITMSREEYDGLVRLSPATAELPNRILALDYKNCLKKMRMLQMRPKAKYEEFIAIYGIGIHHCYTNRVISSFLGLEESYFSKLRIAYSRLN